jgi:hypothetical protein
MIQNARTAASAGSAASVADRVEPLTTLGNGIGPTVTKAATMRAGSMKRLGDAEDRHAVVGWRAAANRRVFADHGRKRMS